MKPETRWRQNTVDPFLTKLGIFKDSIQQKSKHGSADYYLCVAGRFIYFEVKWYGGELTELQKDKMLLVRKQGRGIAICVHPGNWDLVKEFLTKLEKGEKQNVEDEVQRINGVPVPNGNAKTKGRTNGRKNCVPSKPHGSGSEENSGENFSGI